MEKDDRYAVSDLPEAQFEVGSNNEVLKNRVGIKSPQVMDTAEARALEQVVRGLVRRYDEQYRFSAADICKIHKRWLGEIYEWAGVYRQVNISKGGFPFAAAARVPALMAEFEKTVLTRCTPCIFKDRVDVVCALAETHAELLLIHPFREGNGRTARIISILMALQAGLPLLDFSVIAEEQKSAYFAAVQAGLDRDYLPMERLFAEIIERSVASA